VPEGWDGRELRQWLADKYERAVFRGVFSRARKAAYNKAVLVNNLV